MSVLQGEQLSELLRSRQQSWNRAWGGRPVVIGDGPLPSVTLASGLRVTLLSPGPDRLKRLAQSWRKKLRQRDPESRPKQSEEPAGDAAAAAEDLAVEESGVPAAASKGRVAKAPPDPATLDLDALAGQVAALDTSIQNGSSIAFLAELAGIAVLVGADAFAQDLAAAIQRLLDERSLERLPLDGFVVPHAGSRRNLTVELLRMLDCATYLFSGNGRFRTPALETVASVLRFGRPSANTRLSLVFNYRTDANAVWGAPELQQRYNYEAAFPTDDDAGVRVVFGPR